MAHTYDTELSAFELYHLGVEQDSKTSILGGPILPALGHALSGSIGSATSTLLTYPLSLIVTRLQVQKQFRKLGLSTSNAEYTSIADAAVKIYEDEGGLSALFSGCAQDVGKSVADSFLFFLAYNFVRDSRLKARGTKRLPMYEELGSGMVAGAFSRLFTTPISNVVTRKQTAAMTGGRSSGSGRASSYSVREIVEQIREEKGWLGFWSGYSATLLLTLNPALTFLFHETLLRMLVRRDNRKNPGSRITFILAALSKAMASCITYPASLAKSRSQISSKSPTAEPIEKISEQDSVGSASEKAVRNVEKKTIFETIYSIANEDGFLSLYSGLEGEVLKGFFSHGLTMLLKERIHRVVIKLYYFLLKLMKKYPSPEEIIRLTTRSATKKARRLRKSGGQKVEKAMDTIDEIYHHAKDQAMDVVDAILPNNNE